MKYSYDEDGVAFYYFLLVLIGLWVVPTTLRLVLSPKSSKKTPAKCSCKGCEEKELLASKKAGQAFRKSIVKSALLAMGWLGISLLLMAVWNAKTSHQAYDPYQVLGVKVGADETTIRSAFKKLSFQYHPDKVKEEEREEAAVQFVNISKAYKALTDPVIRKNWEEHGNPDGLRSFSAGIALPAWLVAGWTANGTLLVYVVLLMIGLPFLVWKHWAKAKLHTKDGLLHATMGFYYKEMREAMSVKKLVDLLAASEEFKVEQIGKPIDEPKLTQLIEYLAEQSEAITGERYDRPKKFNAPFVIRAHALLYAHMHRIPIEDADLRQVQMMIVGRAPQLVLGMLQIAAARQWAGAALSCMTLSHLLVQGVAENASPLLQLPHIDSTIIKHCRTRKRQIRSVRDLLEMEETDRRALLRTLTDGQYLDVLQVAGNVPMVEIVSVGFRILGQDAITTLGIVTCQVKLALHFAGEAKMTNGEVVDEANEEVDAFEFDEDGNLLDASTARSKFVENRVPDMAPIHAARFPGDKKPFWWVMLASRSSAPEMIVAPVRVVDLLPLSASNSKPKTITLQFQAPQKPGTQLLSVYVKSDAVLGADVVKEVKYTVVAKPLHKEPEETWDISDEDEPEANGVLASSGEED